MKRVIILGAGFSKSIAGLPLTNEMLNKFREVMESQKSLGHRNRVIWGQWILDFWKHLEKEYLIKPYIRAEGKSDIRIFDSNYESSFEAVCSIIDLNLSTEVSARVEENGHTASILGGKSMFWNYASSQLSQIRTALGTYIHLSLIDDNSDKSLLEKFKVLYLDDNTNIITFNYDLILEKFLFKQKLWFPYDGYGFFIDSIPEKYSEFNIPSKIRILKLHGSLNWKYDDLLVDNFRLHWTDDNQNSYFPGYLKDEPKFPFIYQGGHSSGGWIFPSWIKQFRFPEILSVWNCTYKELANAEEIIIIGYSFPQEDTTVVSLFGTVDYKCKHLAIIDPNANEIAKKFKLITRIKDIETIEKNFEELLKG